MNTQEIIATLKNESPKNFDVDRAFQAADQEKNFSFKFGKTKEHWTSTQWNEVAKEVKAKM
jgi:hypothetical protein